MGQWRGIMKSGFLEIPVTVIYNPPSAGLREWSGSGITEKYWPMTPPQFETNIGTVVVVNQAIRSGCRHFIDFKGVGKAKGPLAEVMGWTKRSNKMQQAQDMKAWGKKAVFILIVGCSQTGGRWVKSITAYRSL